MKLQKQKEPNHISILGHTKQWDGHKFQVRVDNQKFPRERGEWYHSTKDCYQDARKQVIVWACGEHDGKFLSPGGLLYRNREEYEKYQDDILNEYVHV